MVTERDHREGFIAYPHPGTSSRRSLRGSWPRAGSPASPRTIHHRGLNPPEPKAPDPYVPHPASPNPAERANVPAVMNSEAHTDLPLPRAEPASWAKTATTARPLRCTGSCASTTNWANATARPPTRPNSERRSQIS